MTDTNKDLNPTDKDLFEKIYEVQPEEVVDNVENFFEKNWKLLAGVLGAIVLVFILFIGYKKWKETQNLEAVSKAYVAQLYFEKDSFNLALNGDKEGNLGFVALADEYSGTAIGNSAYYYAGVSYLQLGNYQKAIEAFDQFKRVDAILSHSADGLTGDCYVELKQYEEALNYYQKASSAKDNDLTTPLYLNKLALVYQELKQDDKALEVYTQLRDNYYTTEQGRNALKYIELLKK